MPTNLIHGHDPERAAACGPSASACRCGARGFILRAVIPVLVLVPLLTGVGLADQYYGPEFFEPTRAVTTPHIPWAVPSAERPLKVLFIVPRAAAREVVELAQRTDLAYRTFLFTKSDILATERPIAVRDADTEDAVDRLTRLLDEPYDAIVLGSVQWDVIPFACRFQILKKVKEGCGLLAKLTEAGERTYLDRALVNPIDPEPGDVLQPLPIPLLPALRELSTSSRLAGQDTRYATFGQGRICLLQGYAVPRGQALTPGPEGDPLAVELGEYDYYCAFVIHLLNWAAGRKHGIRIVDEPLVRSRAGAEPLSIRFLSSLNERLTADIVLRRSLREEVRTLTVPLDLSAGSTALQIPWEPVPAGAYAVDVRVRRGERVVTFGSLPMTVNGTAEINGVVLAQPSITRDDPLRLNVTLGGRLEGLLLRCRRFDNFGRLVRERVVPVTGTKLEVELAPAASYTVVNTVACELLQGPAVIDSRRVPLLISDSGTDARLPYVLFEHGVGFSYLGYRLMESIRSLGFDLVSYASVYDRKHRRFTSSLVRADLRPLPEVYGEYEDVRIELSHGGRIAEGSAGPLRKPCLTDPEHRRKRRQFYAMMAQWLRDYGTDAFNLGDECQFVHGQTSADLCWSTSCLDGFREFVKTTYGTLAALNAAYATEYTGWDAVLPVRNETAIADLSKRAPWTDHRRYIEQVWAGVFADAQAAIREVVPEAKVGYEGSGGITTSFSAEDHWLLARAMTVNGPYPNRSFFHLVRDFSSPDAIIGGGIIGAYPDLARCARNPAYLRYHPWMTLFSGARSFWIYEGTGFRYGGYYAVIAPDYSPYPYFRENVNAIEEIRSGLGQALLGAQREHDGIAILYSAASTHVATLTPGLPHSRRVLAAFPPLLEDCGFQFRFISYAQLADGVLDGSEFRLLILPYGQALADAEVEAITRFTRKGGTVLADLRPGVTDEHGRPRDTGALDALFGVHHNTVKPSPVSSRVTFTGRIGGFGKRLAACVGDATLELAGGTANARIGDAPACVERSVGAGRAILLNLSLSGYGQPEGDWVDALLREFLTGLLRHLGVVPQITFEPAPVGLHAYRFANGNGRYVGVLRDLPAFTTGVNRAELDQDDMPDRTPASVELRLDRDWHVYDCRAGTYLGYTRILRRDIVRGEPHLFALLPYRVAGVRLAAPAQVRQGGALPIELALTGPADSETAAHTLHVTLLGPDGRERTHYGRVLTTTPLRTAKFTVELALNDELGAWQIHCRDVTTGVEAFRDFTVLPQAPDERKADR